MAELIASMVWLAVELLLVFTGKAVICSVSVGRWRSESVIGDEGRIFGAAGALSFVRDGQRVVTPTGLLFAGLAFYILLALGALAYA